MMVKVGRVRECLWSWNNADEKGEGIKDHTHGKVINHHGAEEKGASNYPASKLATIHKKRKAHKTHKKEENTRLERK